MDKPEFLKVLQHFSGSSVQDAEAVLTLKDTFPFSQVLHTLSARVSKDHSFSNFQKELQLAAVYAADRAVLKQIMEEDFVPAAAESKPAQQHQAFPENVISADVATELMNDLEQLHRLKQNFELLFVDLSAASLFTHDKTEPTVFEVPSSEENGKTKKERIIELAKTMSAPVYEPSADVGSSRKRRKKDPLETFIDQIVVSKEELSPESDVAKEQIEIIDHFIKIQPSIAGSKDKQITPSDLSSIKTGEFTENIISETLVEILLKQGKKDKAVEVLKKLIWKFPQKKAYFATQIEELRK